MRRFSLLAVIASFVCAFTMGAVAYADDATGLEVGVAAAGHTVDVQVGDNAKYTLSYGSEGYKYWASSEKIIANDTNLLQTALWKANDFDNIKKGEKVKITLQKGATYEVNDVLRIFSHTDLNLNGATIKRTDDGLGRTMIANYPIGFKSNNSDLWGAYSASEWKKITSNDQIIASKKEVKRESEIAGGYDMSTDIAVYGGTLDGGSVKKAKEASDLVRFDHASNITVKNMTVKNVYDCHHVEFIGVKDGTISNCKFSGFEFKNHKSSVVASALESVELDAAWTDNPGKAGSNPLKWAEKGRWASSSYLDGTHDENCVVEGCTFTDLPTTVGEHHASTDPRCTNSTGIIIRNNTIRATKSQGYKPGITIGGLDNVEVTGNTISGPYAFMIQAYGGTNIKIDGNTLEGGTKNSIMVDKNADGKSATNTVVSNNTIKSAGDHAISVTDANASSISGNIISSPKSNGVNVNSGSVGSIEGNRITAPGNHGISILGGTVGSIADNTIASTKKNGINIGKNAASGTPAVTNITGNAINGSTVHGISMIYGTVKNITGNTIDKTGKTGSGIAVTAGKITLIGSNTIKSAGKNGITVVGGSVGKKGKTATGILNNTISKTKAGMGITISKKGSAAYINSNTIAKPAKNAIAFSGKVTVYQVKSNTITVTKKSFGIWMGGTKVKTAVQKNKITCGAKKYAMGHPKGAKYKAKGNKIKVKK